MALAKSRGAARRPDPRATDARLAELLRAYHVSAPTRQAAAHTRQHNLVVVDSLCAQLEQVRVLGRGKSTGKEGKWAGTLKPLARTRVLTCWVLDPIM